MHMAAHALTTSHASTTSSIASWCSPGADVACWVRLNRYRQRLPDGRPVPNTGMARRIALDVARGLFFPHSRRRGARSFSVDMFRIRCFRVARGLFFLHSRRRGARSCIGHHQQGQIKKISLCFPPCLGSCGSWCIMLHVGWCPTCPVVDNTLHCVHPWLPMACACVPTIVSPPCAT